MDGMDERSTLIVIDARVLQGQLTQRTEGTREEAGDGRGSFGTHVIAPQVQRS